MRKTIFLCLALFTFSIAAFAQPRPIEKKPEQKAEQTAVARTPAPGSFTAKYEGGMYGFSKRETGTLKFDDANKRIVFYGKDQKEMFGIPYKSMLVIYPNSRSVRSTAGTVGSVIPLPGAGLLGLLREKRRYLVVNYDDPDVDAKGLVNFKLANKELLESVIQTLGEKAELTKRGDAFYRPKATDKNNDIK